MLSTQEHDHTKSFTSAHEILPVFYFNKCLGKDLHISNECLCKNLLIDKSVIFTILVRLMILKFHILIQFAVHHQVPRTRTTKPLLTQFYLSNCNHPIKNLNLLIVKRKSWSFLYNFTYYYSSHIVDHKTLTLVLKMDSMEVSASVSAYIGRILCSRTSSWYMKNASFRKLIHYLKITFGSRG